MRRPQGRHVHDVHVDAHRTIPRGGLCRQHKGDREVTQFCQHSEIGKEMDRCCDLDVIAKGAWLQWAFLRIHPFADGNGRVARLISSMPLCELGLPPVAVKHTNKAEYLEYLRLAHRENKAVPLAAFVREAIWHTGYPRHNPYASGRRARHKLW